VGEPIAVKNGFLEIIMLFFLQQPETFWTLLHDKAHWEFEIFLMLLFDGIIGALLWPFIKRHWNHHIDRDKKEGNA
jgi:hypothetical protein